MHNRFIRLIEAGIIETEAALKSEFRARALETHPDQAEADDRGVAFIRLKAEYEVALRYLAPPVRESASAESGRSYEASSRRNPGRATGRAPGRTRYDRDLFYADLSALLKAGFPKVPRHDRERRKYARLRLLVLSSLEALDEAFGEAGAEPRGLGSRPPAPGSGARDGFYAFEAELLALRALGTPEAEARIARALSLAVDLVDYAECGIMALRAAIEIELADLRAEGGALADFLGLLVDELDDGRRPMTS